MALTSLEQQRIQDAIADLAEDAKRVLRGSEHYRATVLLRTTHVPDGDVVVTDDAPEKIFAALQRRFPEHKSLLERLLRYVGHDLDCCHLDDPNACLCGLDELLREAGLQLGPPPATSGS